MKRLLQVSFDTALLSLIPVLSWFMLSIIVDENLINVFTLTYPIQFIYYMFKSVFSTGANISKEKDKDSYAVGNGLIVGILLALMVYGFILINIDEYIIFMNMDVETYKIFAIYSVVQLYIQLVFNFVIEKLYYEEKNNVANKYSIIFNLINFSVLILTALIFNNNYVIIILTLLSIFIYTIYILFKNMCKFNFKINVFKFLKYDSVNFSKHLLFFLIFLFGLKNATSYGLEYTNAITFISLITDTQWDVIESIKTLAAVDLSKGNFNYKKSQNDAYKLNFLLILSIIVMFFILYKNYNLNMGITTIFLLVEIINFIIYPIYTLKSIYLNLEYSYVKSTTNKVISNLLRMFLSFLKTPYCTLIGQIISSLYQFVSYEIMYKKAMRCKK